MSVRRAVCGLGLALAAWAAAAPAWAQTEAAGLPALPQPMPVATLDQDRLFGDSLYGQALQKLLDGEVAALNAENRGIEADLETEEQELTDRRAGLPLDEFRKLADAFDAKAEDIRKRQGTKARALSERQDRLRGTFYERAMPILAEVMAERGIVAIIDKKAIVMAFGRIDITDAAVARINATLGDGSGSRKSPGPLAPGAERGGDAPAGGVPAPVDPAP